jgi:hypothetical protein
VLEPSIVTVPDRSAMDDSAALAAAPGVAAVDAPLPLGVVPTALEQAVAASATNIIVSAVSRLVPGWVTCDLLRPIGLRSLGGVGDPPVRSPSAELRDGPTLFVGRSQGSIAPINVDFRRG